MLYNTISRICARRGVTVSRLERDIGFSNGCIRKWNSCEPGIYKVQKVAVYLGIPIDQLLEK